MYNIDGLIRLANSSNNPMKIDAKKIGKESKLTLPLTSKCPQCGYNLSPDMWYCAMCGRRLDSIISQKKLRRGPDFLGLLSIGVILLLLGFTYIRYPIATRILTNYINFMIIQKMFIKPPQIILNAATFFLYAIGGWNIILAGLRVIAQQGVQRASTTFIGGCFSMWCAYLLSLYATDFFTEQTTLAYIVIGIGLMILVQSLIRFLTRRASESEMR